MSYWRHALRILNFFLLPLSWACHGSMAMHVCVWDDFANELKNNRFDIDTIGNFFFVFLSLKFHVIVSFQMLGLGTDASYVIYWFPSEFVRVYVCQIKYTFECYFKHFPYCFQWVDCHIQWQWIYSRFQHFKLPRAHIYNIYIYIRMKTVNKLHRWKCVGKSSKQHSWRSLSSCSHKMFQYISSEMMTETRNPCITKLLLI